MNRWRRPEHIRRLFLSYQETFKRKFTLDVSLFLVSLCVSLGMHARDMRTIYCQSLTAALVQCDRLGLVRYILTHSDPCVSNLMDLPITESMLNLLIEFDQPATNSALYIAVDVGSVDALAKLIASKDYRKYTLESVYYYLRRFDPNLTGRMAIILRDALFAPSPTI